MPECDNEAPFFRDFPPEVRNLIYAMALGNGIINVRQDDYTKPELKHLRLEHPCVPRYSHHYHANTHDRQTSRYAQGLFPKVQSNDNRSKDAYNGYSAQLLRICKQVYVEAALLLFAKNEFRVHGRALNVFMDQLLPKQKQAIQKLTVLCHDEYLPIPRVNDILELKDRSTKISL